MDFFSQSELKKLYINPKDSHKGQNGKLTIIGGSRLFHGASLWALKVTSRIVDMVFYSSVPENNELTKELKKKLYDFIAIPREGIEEYIKESDAVLLGPGLPREEGKHFQEESTYELTKRLLSTFPGKKWIIDAGSLTEMNPNWLLDLNCQVIITPHTREFEKLFGLKPTEENVINMSKKYNCIILLKGETDVVSSPSQSVKIRGGNEGMTKGGTGDVLSGLVAALACKNDLFLAACAGSFVNKKVGDSLYEKVGPYYDASDLCDEIPRVLHQVLLDVKL